MIPLPPPFHPFRLVLILHEFWFSDFLRFRIWSIANMRYIRESPYGRLMGSDADKADLASQSLKIETDLPQSSEGVTKKVAALYIM